MYRTIMRRGFSLIELMIAIALGLFLLLVLTQLMSQQSSARGEIEKSSRQIENGRYAMSLLQEDLQLAGYYGQSGAPAAITLPAALPNPCELGATAASLTNIANSLTFAVQGYNDFVAGSAGFPSCLPTANHLDGTDILVVRRAEASNAVTAVADADANTVYLQTTPAEIVVGKTAVANNFTLRNQFPVLTPALADLRRYVVRIYFVSPCNVPSPAAETDCTSAADNGRPIPTLKRLELVGGVFTVTPLVEGIENLQLDYGIDRNSDGAPDELGAEPSFKSNPTIAEFSNVVAVRVNLLARATQSSPGYVDNRSYQLGLTAIAGPGDEFKRQAYSVAVRLNNVSGRRE